jgi:RND family efflux transporter MFP subunit
MTDGTSKLDALRIDRAAPPPRRGFGLVLGVAVVLLLLAAGGAAAYVWWPAAGIPVQAVTAEADAAGGGGAGLDATGYVVARRQATISAKIAGKLVEANLEEGEHVAQGQIVARLDDSNYKSALNVALASEKQAETMLADAEPTYLRYQKLRAQNAISEDTVQTQKTLYDSARMSLIVAKAAVVQAQTNENDTVVRAPFTGIVTAKVAQAGEFVAPSAGGGGGGALTGIATIVDMNSLEVEVDVSENYIERVHAGGQATIVLDAYPDWEIPANVIAVIPTADQTKGTVKVRIGIKSRDARILPQMGARVTFLTAPQPQNAPVSHGVSVPPQAVQQNGRSGTVFVIKDDDTVEMRSVQIGVASSRAVMIRSGVAAGERLATGDLAKLQNGAKVKIQE